MYSSLCLIANPLKGSNSVHLTRACFQLILGIEQKYNLVFDLKRVFKKSVSLSDVHLGRDYCTCSTNYFVLFLFCLFVDMFLNSFISMVKQNKIITLFFTTTMDIASLHLAIDLYVVIRFYCVFFIVNFVDFVLFCCLLVYCFVDLNLFFLLFDCRFSLPLSYGEQFDPRWLKRLAIQEPVSIIESCEHALLKHIACSRSTSHCLAVQFIVCSKL